MSVIITNLSTTTTKQQVEDFFNFCGKIASLTVTRVDDNNAQAIVTFEAETACKTAVLLDNALINDRPIKVENYDPAQTKSPAPVPQATQAPVQQQPATLVDSTNALETVPAVDPLGPAPPAENPTPIANFFASTWHAFSIVGEKIAEVDKQYKISESARSTADKVSTSFKNFDETHQISTKAAGVVSQIGVHLTNLDQKYEVSTKMAGVGDAVNKGMYTATSGINSGISNVSTKVNTSVENSPTMVAGVQKVKEAGANLQNVGSNAKNIYAEKQQQRMQDKGVVPGDTLAPTVAGGPDGAAPIATAPQSSVPAVAPVVQAPPAESSSEAALAQAPTDLIQPVVVEAKLETSPRPPSGPVDTA
mmetsp:Transcript_14246/g.15784  ORF Transcript_14246/g.15784 Transcript_14246/m.15784 type:complete len:363 (+) Transcript_14246:40-1128(+)